jgi:opacity protein-like surface antigen
VVCAVLAVALPARAQSIEVAGLFAYTNSAKLDTLADNVEELSVNGALTWGAGATFFLTEHLGVEGLFMQQPTTMRLTANGASAPILDLTIRQVVANLVYQLGATTATFQPFVFGGAGISTLISDDRESESKFAWTVGGGVKWMPNDVVGTRIHFRYKATRLNDSDAAVCDPFGFCQDALPQLEIAGGLVFRF